MNSTIGKGMWIQTFTYIVPTIEIIFSMIDGPAFEFGVTFAKTSFFMKPLKEPICCFLDASGNSGSDKHASQVVVQAVTRSAVNFST